MKKILTKKFFERPTLTVARELVGKYIVVQTATQTNRATRIELAVMITEVEAYDGPFDLASHARSGRTPRASILFGPAGVFYIFFIYGMHWMINVVTGPDEYPAAILLRAGIYRDPKTGKIIHINGPARLATFLKITGALNHKPALKKSGAWFEDRGIKTARRRTVASKRIGVDYAGPIWSEKKWNFKLIKPNA